MKNFKNKIPTMLVYSRLAIAWLILIVALLKPAGAGSWIMSFLIIGLLTDVFDGIIARKLNVSTTHLRQLDTKIDRIFWLTALFSLMMLHPVFLFKHIIQITVLLLLEAIAWIVGRIKFQNNISFHSLLSKFWAIALLLMFIDVLPDGIALITFNIVFWYGVLAQADIILIALILPEYQCDIPSSWHALRIRKGKTIKRMQLFNG